MDEKEQALKIVIKKIIESYMYYPYEWKLDWLIDKYYCDIKEIIKDRETSVSRKCPLTNEQCEHFHKTIYDNYYKEKEKDVSRTCDYPELSYCKETLNTKKNPVFCDGKEKEKEE